MRYRRANEEAFVYMTFAVVAVIPVHTDRSTVKELKEQLDDHSKPKEEFLCRGNEGLGHTTVIPQHVTSAVRVQMIICVDRCFALKRRQ